MKILITAATSNVGRGMIPRLKSAGHDLVLLDLNRVPETEPYVGLPFVQCDIQTGFGLERAAAGCDLILHLPAWHGIHWWAKTEIDYWRLNIDGTFWMFQAAQAAGVKRIVFLSSMAWHDHYGKYGFTKRIGEELCEYNRRNHGIRYVAIRPEGFVPWRDYLEYGAHFLYYSVHRDDVMECVYKAIEALIPEKPADTEAEAIVVDAVRPNAFTAEQIEGWGADPIGTCERIFPGSRPLIEKYKVPISEKPRLTSGGAGGERIGWQPMYHFGSFLDELRRLDGEGGEELVRSQVCSF